MNMAEKLAPVDFLDFKILILKDFHFDWYVASRCATPMINPTKARTSLRED